MLLGCIADDFTGASDLANTLTRGGLRTALAVGVPAAAPAPFADDEALAAADAIVVALKTRTIEPAAAVAQSLAAFAWLRRAGAQQFLFKICSTFDSRFATEPRGNIGPVGSALRLALAVDALKPPCIPVCPAFPATGRSVYRGHLFVGDQLLSDSGMAQHPLTPMTDASLVRVLQAQCSERVGLIGLDTVRAGAAAIAVRLAELARQGSGFAVVDAIDESDLHLLGAALDGLPLAIGASGLALGLPATLARRGLRLDFAPLDVRAPGPCVLLAGSCSLATRAQVAAQAAHGPVLRVDPARAADTGYLADAVDWCLAESANGTTPLVASSADPAAVAAACAVRGAEVAEAIEQFFGALAAALAARGVRRFVVAGGETSGAVVTALGVRSMRIGAEIDPGVPALRAFARGAREPLALALKSGNFGGPDFFQRAQAYL
jgi:uncharacterized protein YgbK (DUF1537 family)